MYLKGQFCHIHYSHYLQNDTPQPHHKNILYLQYADHTVLTHRHTYTFLNTIITREFHHIKNYQSHWLINTNKSAIVLYKQDIRRIKYYNPIRVNNEIKETRILGVNFYHKLNFKKIH